MGFVVSRSGVGSDLLYVEVVQTRSGTLRGLTRAGPVCIAAAVRMSLQVVASQSGQGWFQRSECFWPAVNPDVWCVAGCWSSTSEGLTVQPFSAEATELRLETCRIFDAPREHGRASKEELALRKCVADTVLICQTSA